MTEYERKTSEALEGKVIKKAQITGHAVVIECTDGTKLDYSASDGGYSCWDVYLPGGESVGVG